jgi:hypothetical protein
MLNGRLYRATLAPVLLALGVAAFSLGGRPAPLVSTLAPDAFEGAGAFATLQSLERKFPERRPGSAGDARLAAYIAQSLKGLGGTAGGGFAVHVTHFDGPTIEGERSLTTVTATRPGSTGAAPIVILAHRDAAKSGSEAELSGTAALLELAGVFAARETERTIVLVSTSGGSGGAAGAEHFLAETHGPIDAAIVLGDLAGRHARMPSVVPFSNGFGSAPLQLQRTVVGAIAQASGANPGEPSTLGELAHLTFPLAVGEEGVLDGGGLPAVLVQVSGERGPAASEPVSEERLEGYGRGVLSAVDALDIAPEISHTMQSGLPLQRKVVPAWAVRLLTLVLLLGPLLVACDGLARLRRRRQGIGRWLGWTLVCGLPFLVSVLFARVLGLSGIIRAAPASPVLPSSLPLTGRGVGALATVALVFVLSWLSWPMILRRAGLPTRPTGEGAGLGMLFVLLAVAAVVWVGNPYTALLLLGAVHLWMLIVSPEVRPRPAAALALVLLAFVPLALLVTFYAHQLGLGAANVVWEALLLFAGGHVGLAGALVWSGALGCAAAAAMLAVTSPPGLGAPNGEDGTEITIRGPLSYAGPGSLGGTESALRR